MESQTIITGRLPVIGLMLGDMTGIGPEISAKLLAGGSYRNDARVVVIGDARVLELGCRDAGVELQWQPVPTVAAIDWSQARLPLVDLGNIDAARIGRGEVSAESGRLAGETLAHMMASRSAAASTAFASRRSTRPRSTAAAGNTPTSTRCSPRSPGIPVSSAK